eukprot:TRINITY_DN10065_c0_g1_i1.p1 TRINITY_DN10065_c0_g1~~TRINITY_DN10065_c0_g1_i1.p1  ORF type:complete len:190 (-),score=15.58 TRINITY_DN10065_c0_g1_i1:22-591(-)
MKKLGPSILSKNFSTLFPTRAKIYTKTGDKGESSLFNGERRKKDDEVFEALGATDELNAHLGLAIEHCKAANNALDTFLEEIQSRLLDIGSHVATPRSSSPEKHLERTLFNENHVKTLETWIDKLDNELPPLRNFILPSGGFASSQLHVARTVCRRAERSIAPLYRLGLVDTQVFQYINRSVLLSLIHI